MLSKVSLVALIAIGGANATTYTFTNVFPDNHIIGDVTKFAIQSVIINVTSTQVAVTINTNYDNANLNPFTIQTTNHITHATDTYTIQIGDFFFTQGGQLQFGVPIENHGGVVNGYNTGSTVLKTDLYAINGASGVLSSDQVINKQAGDTDLSFNNGVKVWLDGSGSLTDYGSIVTPVVTPLTAHGTQPFYTINFTVARPASASDPFNQLLNSGTFGFQFESASCANDYFSGSVPEPATLSLFGLGCVAMSLRSKAVRSGCRRLLRIHSN